MDLKVFRRAKTARSLRSLFLLGRMLSKEPVVRDVYRKNWCRPYTEEDRCGINTGGSVRDVYRRIGPSRIKEDRCGTYTGGLVRDLYRRTGAGSIQEDWSGTYTGVPVSDVYRDGQAGP